MSQDVEPLGAQTLGTEREAIPTCDLSSFFFFFFFFGLGGLGFHYSDGEVQAFCSNGKENLFRSCNGGVFSGRLIVDCALKTQLLPHFRCQDNSNSLYPSSF